MTMGMILNEGNVLRVRTSKTAQYVEHALDRCELVVRCLERLKHCDSDLPVDRRANGSPWATHMAFGKQWRIHANEAGVPKKVWNMDNRRVHTFMSSGALRSVRSFGVTKNTTLRQESVCDHLKCWKARDLVVGRCCRPESPSWRKWHRPVSVPSTSVPDFQPLQ